jgi:hypothetical protein
VQHDDPNHIFTVNIARTALVGTLKDLIKDKKKTTFQGCEVTDLDIWKVSALYWHQLTLMQAVGDNVVCGRLISMFIKTLQLSATWISEKVSKAFKS